MKFFVRFNNSNKNLIIYPPKQKGHFLFAVPLDKLKDKEINLFFEAFGPICEIRITDAIDLHCYLRLRNLSVFDIFTK